jgi:D-arabinose 1-dehydrogenase-like Zn-dependent alcohol dehydrogenase
MNTMKAAVVPALGAPLEIRDLAVPDPGPGQVLVRMETSGICHTDIHAAHGDWQVTPQPPFVPGHEGIGIVEKLCAGSSVRQAGDRVAIAWLGSACGRCRYCVSAARRCARPSRTAATRSTAHTRSTPSPTSATSSPSPTPSPPGTPPR